LRPDAPEVAARQSEKALADLIPEVTERAEQYHWLSLTFFASFKTVEFAGGDAGFGEGGVKNEK
jgi:hypothetical protein